MTKRLTGKHNGQFQPGNPGGPGRPPRQTEAEYLRATLAAVSLDAWEKIVQRAVQDALQGDHQARAWLSAYLLGKPATSAPSLTVVAVQQITGTDPVAEKVARHAEKLTIPGL